MSQQNQTNMMYSRDFLLQYQHIRKHEPTIVEKIQPYVSPSRKARTPGNDSQSSPARRGESEFRPSTQKKRGANLPDPSSPTKVIPVWRPTPVKPTHLKSDPESSRKSARKGNAGRTPLVETTRPVRSIQSPLLTAAINQATFTNKENLANPQTSVVSASSKIEKSAAPSVRLTPATPPTPEEILSPVPTSVFEKIDEAPAAEPLQEVSEDHASSVLDELGETLRNLDMASGSNFLLPPVPSTPTQSPLKSPSEGKSPATRRSPKSPKSSPKIIDNHQLEQRQKQVDYGHQTVGYLRYRLLVPKEKRSRDDPRTPKKTQACSKRSWDGQVKKWRRDLHKWDPEEPQAFMAWLESDFVMKMIENNIGMELIELTHKIKERLAKFENSPDPSVSPSASPTASPGASPTASPLVNETRCATGADVEEESKVVRKLVF